MADIVSPKNRSSMMANIPSKDTKPEEIVRKYLFSKGFRFRKNDKRYPGKPDIVLPKYHTVIFVNGCFWHRHQGCKRTTTPTSNQEFWLAKFQKNVQRDQLDYSLLEKMGWRVIVVWECEILSKKRRASRLSSLINEITA